MKFGEKVATDFAKSQGRCLFSSSSQVWQTTPTNSFYLHQSPHQNLFAFISSSWSFIWLSPLAVNVYTGNNWACNIFTRSPATLAETFILKSPKLHKQIIATAALGGHPLTPTRLGHSICRAQDQSAKETGSRPSKFHGFCYSAAWNFPATWYMANSNWTDDGGNHGGKLVAAAAGKRHQGMALMAMTTTATEQRRLPEITAGPERITSTANICSLAKDVFSRPATGPHWTTERRIWGGLRMNEWKGNARSPWHVALFDEHPMCIDCGWVVLLQWYCVTGVHLVVVVVADRRSDGRLTGGLSSPIK